MLRASILGALVFALAGCPSMQTSPDASDVTMMDSGQTDAPSEAAVMDVLMVSYGHCGMRSYNCLCGCGDSGTCQQGCFQANPTCLTCLRDAIMTCCPDAWNAFSACISAAITPDDSGVAACSQADNNCLLMQCMMQANALDACQASASCAGPTRSCLGTYPQTCGM